jgi:hypothetical protein
MILYILCDELMNNLHIYIMTSMFYLFLYTNLNLAVIIHIYKMESVYNTLKQNILEWKIEYTH